jgi:GNAT superfamily N-acetyltransferase
MSGTIVRLPEARDEAVWRELWAGYNKFYRATVDEAVTASLWRRIMAGGGDIDGLVAESGGVVTGLVHLLFHPSSWSLKPSCYLEDLFVAPHARGTGAGRALIAAVVAAAKARGADRVYWHTQDYNAPARSLYDNVAARTSFIVYRIDLG